ncbi:MAG: SDR family oxidoreductase [Sphingomonadales bacterium]|nr:SDR family oxidoreductase [Sphingomonadales bacterium]MBU3992171.1 SDR family oxidoreductase [Alphaproteobacteria bacterium]
MDLGIAGKAFAIVGGTSGMGYAAARVLAADGARIALIGRDQAAGDERAARLAAETGATVQMFAGDGSKPGEVEAAIAAAAQAFGELNGLAVTAGPMLAQTYITETSDADWQAYFDVQLMTTVRANRAILPLLKAAGGGTIVNTSAYSIHAQHGERIAYTAMKAAIASVTKNIALTSGKDGIRANTVCPGFIATDAAQPLMEMMAKKYGLPPLEALDKAMVEDFHMDVALGRVGRPEELGELIAFLLSARAGYLTGALINADGGTQF